VNFSWEKLVTAVQDHIGSLNWSYRVALKDKNVDYQNSYATFIDPHTIKATTKRGKSTTYTSKYFVIATGGRPKYPDIPGAKEYCITSDDIFSMQTAPGKTLIVGASYIALECAGFLHGLGFDATVMVRSIFLRGFDQQMANKVADHMLAEGVKFIREAVPTKIEKLDDGKLVVTYSGPNGEQDEIFDTVMFATGRDVCTTEIGLDKAGVEIDKRSLKVFTNDADQTNVPHIFAIGDILLNKPELTPMAIQSGQLLAARLFGGATELADYNNVATTVFTPMEYGCVGLSEEAAVEKFGEDDVEIFHGNFTPLQFTVPHRDANTCYAKMICVKSQDNRLVGFHLFSPDAGEITQGFAVAFKLGARVNHIHRLVGIHPTSAEAFTTLTITKSSGEDINAKGC
jgi:thioredoxin reductase (NADPH)